MVGVCIKYMHENYGGILQAYATVSYLENQNIEYELIRYTRKKTVTEALKDVPRLFNAVWFNSRYEGIQRKLSLKKHPEYAKNNQIRMKAFAGFKKWAFKDFSDEYVGYAALRKGGKKYSAVITGRKTDSDISVCGVDKIFEKKQEEKKQYHCNYEEIAVDQAIEWLLLGQKIESGAWNKLFKASTIEDVHFEEGKKINEDKYFVFRSLLKSKKIVYCAEKLYYYYCRENSVTNQSFSERWFDSLYFADRIYEELKGRNNLEVFARYQLLIAYYTVLRRMYPFRNQYKKEYQLVIDKIKSTSFKSVLSYMDKKQVFGVLSIKYCILLYKFMRCVSK